MTGSLIENAFKIIKVLVENNFVLGRSLTGAEIAEASSLEETDYESADTYLLQCGYIEGGGGGPDSVRSATADGIEYYEQNKIKEKAEVIPSLTPEQKELLLTLVEAYRNVPPTERIAFGYWKTMSSGETVKHPGLPQKRLRVLHSDIFMLAEEKLLFILPDSRRFDITQKGFELYEVLKKQLGESTQRIEDTARQYLDAVLFQQRYPEAYTKWTDAESLLWSSESEGQYTTIGHLCREAIQAFAVSLAEQHPSSNIDQSLDKALTKIRIEAIINDASQQLGRTEKRYLKALFTLWDRANDLIQRQEHDSQRENTPLVWEDGRRVVFQTFMLMHEIDRGLALKR